MYSDNADPGVVSKAYQNYYYNNKFIKNSDTQYYKRWLRSFSRDDARFKNSSERNAELDVLEQAYIQKSLTIKNLESPTSQWQTIGPIDF